MLLLPVLPWCNFEIPVSISKLVRTACMFILLLILKDKLIIQVQKVAFVKKTASKKERISSDTGNWDANLVAIVKLNG